MRYALCVMRYALCVMRYALCVMRYALCVMRYARNYVIIQISYPQLKNNLNSTKYAAKRLTANF